MLWCMDSPAALKYNGYRLKSLLAGTEKKALCTGGGLVYKCTGSAHRECRLRVQIFLHPQCKSQTFNLSL